MTISNLPLYIETFADATGVGKSLSAWRIRHFLDEAGVPNIMVRIETRGVEAKLREGDIAIAVEDFAQAADRPGGIAGVLQPLSATILAAAKTRHVVIADWAGGTARHHLEYVAKTRLDEVLQSIGMTGFSIAVTTNRTEQMRQAADNLNSLEKAAPGLRRGLLLNKRFGDFNFLAGSKQEEEYRGLMRAARTATVIEFPAVVGNSWKTAEDARLSMPDVIKATPAFFAERTGLDAITAMACITEIAVFYELTKKALVRVLRFPKVAKA